MVSVILAGGGKGIRLENKLPKSLVKIKGKELFIYSIKKFHSLKEVTEIILVLPEKYIFSIKKKLKNKFPKLKGIISGGKTRQESVFLGLKALTLKNKIVLIHDVARPFVSKEIIKNVIEKTKRYGACIPVIPIVDTLKEVKGKFVVKTVDREKIFSVQTPQGFKREVIQKAYEKAKKENFYGSDDASLVENLGKRVYIIKGEYQNIKITVPFDLKIAKQLWK